MSDIEGNSPRGSAAPSKRVVPREAEPFQPDHTHTRWALLFADTSGRYLTIVRRNPRNCAAHAFDLAGCERCAIEQFSAQTAVPSGDRRSAMRDVGVSSRSTVNARARPRDKCWRRPGTFPRSRFRANGGRVFRPGGVEKSQYARWRAK